MSPRLRQGPPAAIPRPAGSVARPRLLVVGGDDHRLRIPFLAALRGHGFDVVAAGTDAAAPFADADIPYVRYAFDRFVNPSADLRAMVRIREIAADVVPDIVQTFDTKPNILVPMALGRNGRARVVRTVNGLGWVFSTRAPLALALRPVLVALFRAAAARTSLTVFQNRVDRSFFERAGLVGPGGSRLIPGSGIDVPAFERALAAAVPPHEMRCRLGIGDGEVVATVTRLSRIKGIATLLEAAAMVHAQRPGVRFLLVGPRETGGPSAVSEAEISRHHPYVTATGPVSDVASVLGLADVFVLPTELREGVPRVLLEAATAGVPIVTTDMPGCTDIVEDGTSGFVVPPRHPARLAGRIIAQLEDRTRAGAMAARARELVAGEFNLDAVVEQYAGAYRGLALADPHRSGTHHLAGGVHDEAAAR